MTRAILAEYLEAHLCFICGADFWCRHREREVIQAEVSAIYGSQRDAPPIRTPDRSQIRKPPVTETWLPTQEPWEKRRLQYLDATGRRESA